MSYNCRNSKDDERAGLVKWEYDSQGLGVASAAKVLNQRTSRQLLTIRSRTRASMSCLALQGLATASKDRFITAALWVGSQIKTNQQRPRSITTS
ncbi:hypothetical protein VTL71DRAFT_10786 [Oculimacula yallundae]|uniref:Uncharacterized protein n=1 Tax=Oculimacula yallundae TaxID=86028 RepID=A0ABR4CUF6_9HELO